VGFTSAVKERRSYSDRQTRTDRRRKWWVRQRNWDEIHKEYTLCMEYKRNSIKHTVFYAIPPTFSARRKNAWNSLPPLVNFSPSSMARWLVSTNQLFLICLAHIPTCKTSGQKWAIQQQLTKSNCTLTWKMTKDKIFFLRFLFLRLRKWKRYDTRKVRDTPTPVPHLPHLNR